MKLWLGQGCKEVSIRQVQILFMLVQACYCSKRCQRKDWERHKDFCTHVINWTEERKVLKKKAQ